MAEEMAVLEGRVGEEEGDIEEKLREVEEFKEDLQMGRLGRMRNDANKHNYKDS